MTEQDPPTQAIKEFQQILSDGERWHDRALVAEQKLQQAEAKITSLEELCAFRANAILKGESKLRVLTEALERFVRAAQYVGAHQYGNNTPAGPRIIAVSDLVSLIPGAVQALAAAKKP